MVHYYCYDIATDVSSSNTVATELSQPMVPPLTRELPPVPDSLSLLKHVAVKAPDQFEFIALELGFEDPEINIIQSKYNNDSRKCFREIFQKWKQRTTPPYTWETIINILESDLIDRKDLAQELKSKCGLQID